MFSYITTVFPASVLPSNTNSTSTVPFAFSALNDAFAVTSFPASSFNVSPVVLSIAVPVTVYFSPGTRFRYATVSVRVTSLPASDMCESVSLSLTLVKMSGMWTVCASSSMSACTAISLSV